MTEKEFKETLSALGNSPEFDGIAKTRKRKNIIRAGIACAAAVLVAAAVTVVLLANNSGKGTKLHGGGEVLAGTATPADIDPEATPTEATPTPTEESATPTAKPTEAPTATPDAGNTAYMSLPAGRGLKFLTNASFTTTRRKAAVSESFRQNYTAFALDLLKKTGSGNGTLVSPLSILTATLMTAGGAKGETLDEMLAVLAGGADLDSAYREFFNFCESLTSSENAKLESANSVFVTDREDFKINKRFIHEINETFRGQVAAADFTDDKSVDDINSWCDEHTGGMIPKVLNYDDVDENTVMVLLNAICFDALWREPFTEFNVADGVFHGTGGDRNVKMMSSLESYYFEDGNATGFMKYYSGRYAFAAILPNEGVSMESYLENLDAGTFLSLTGTDAGSANISMPKFSFEWSASLNDVLRDMGIKKAFDSGTADFSGLGGFANEAGEVDEEANPGLYIGNVIHKTRIDVNESGTKAAAVTAVVMPGNSGPDPEPPKTVILDRPFIYAIVDYSTKLPIFIGVLNDIK
jgi:serpin B